MEKNDRIYIAGHKGMVGSALVRQLQKYGYNNLILRTSDELDLRDQKKVRDFFHKEKPEYVFLAAARVGGIKENSTYPVNFLMDNLSIQNNIFENSYINGIKKLLFLGSACIFPKECEQPIREEYLLTGLPEPTNEPYAIAKIAGVRACSYYNRQYGTSYIAVTPANSYGIGDCFDPDKSHVIPALIRKYHEAKKKRIEKIEIWGTGKPLREFLYVDDLADACIFLMNGEQSEDLYNIGSGFEISILELSHMIKKIVGYEGELICDVTKPDGMLRRFVDNRKIELLGWKAKISLEEGLSRTYQWFLDNYSDEV